MLKLVVSLALMFFAGHNTKVVAVVGLNAAFPSAVVANSLEEAESEARAYSKLDPVCFSVPQLCEDRYRATIFYVIYEDGFMEEVFPQ